MKRKHRRAVFLFVGLALLGGATALVLTALGGNIVYFYTPSQAGLDTVEPGQRIRLGGFVETASVRRVGDGTIVEFRVTDHDKSVTVRYRGILPDLFREGQGVVTEGTFEGGTFEEGTAGGSTSGGDRLFVASSVLAKHDENYIPKALADQMKERGIWKDGAGGTDGGGYGTRPGQ